MTRIIGRTASIGFAKETTRGTSVAPLYWIPVRSVSFDDKLDIKENESGFGNIAGQQDAQIIKQWAEGDFEGKIYDQSEGLLLRSLFGQAPASVQRTTTGVYDHDWSMANTNAHTSLTTAISEANNKVRYALSMIDTYAFEASLDDYVHRTVSLISKKSATASDTASYTNENEFIPKHVVVKTAAAGASNATIDSATAIKARMVSLEINKNVEGLQVFGSNDLDDVVNKQLEVTGKLELYYDDTTFRNLWTAGTHQALRIDVVSDIIIGTSGTHTPAIRFQMPEVVYTSWERSFDNKDVMTQTLEFRALFNLAGAAMITARLTNAHVGTNYA